MKPAAILYNPHFFKFSLLRTTCFTHVFCFMLCLRINEAIRCTVIGSFFNLHTKLTNWSVRFLVLFIDNSDKSWLLHFPYCSPPPTVSLSLCLCLSLLIKYLLVPREYTFWDLSFVVDISKQGNSLLKNVIVST